MRRPLSNTVFAAVWVLWLLGAVLGVFVTVHSLIIIVDAEGVQMQNKADPFGTPPSGSRASVRLVVGVLLVAWPVPFVRRFEREETMGER